LKLRSYPLFLKIPLARAAFLALLFHTFAILVLISFRQQSSFVNEYKSKSTVAISISQHESSSRSLNKFSASSSTPLSNEPVLPPKPSLLKDQVHTTNKSDLGNLRSTQSESQSDTTSYKPNTIQKKPITNQSTINNNSLGPILNSNLEPNKESVVSKDLPTSASAYNETNKVDHILEKKQRISGSRKGNEKQLFNTNQFSSQNVNNSSSHQSSKSKLAKGSSNFSDNTLRDKPQCKNCIEPKYPQIALRKGNQGVVKIKVLIARSGRVIRADLIVSSGHSVLDKAALRAASNSTFYPMRNSNSRTIHYDMNIKTR